MEDVDLAALFESAKLDESHPLLGGGSYELRHCCVVDSLESIFFSQLGQTVTIVWGSSDLKVTHAKCAGSFDLDANDVLSVHSPSPEDQPNYWEVPSM